MGAMDTFTLADLRQVARRSLGAGDTPELTEATLDTDLDDLGYDSLAVYELVTLLQDDLSVPISDDDVEGLTTPRSVIDLVNTRLGAVSGGR